MEIPTTNKPLENYTYLKQIKKNIDDFLEYHQLITLNYFIKSDIRGMLIYYTMGFGKTYAGAAIAYYCLKNMKKKVIHLSTKSLHLNAKDTAIEYHKIMGESDDKAKLEVEKNYRFVTLNSSNVAKKLIDDSIITEKKLVEQNIKNEEDENFEIDDEFDLEKNEDEDLLEKNEDFLEKNKIKGSAEKLKLDAIFSNFVKHKNNLKNSIVVVDEAHLFFNSIVNGSKNALEVYDIFMKTDDIKILFLTGTPIVNDVFEIVPCINILKGSPVLSESYDSFYEHFVRTFYENDVRKNHTKNLDKFTDIIYGCISYYGDFYTNPTSFSTNKVIKRPNFPDQFPFEVVKINMTQEVYEKYESIRINEREEAKKSSNFLRKAKPLNKPTSSSSSTYRIRSRQISMYMFPEHVETIDKNNKVKRLIDLSKMTEDDYKNIKKYSPKYDYLLEDTEKYPDQLIVIYSPFVQNEGEVLNKSYEYLKNYELCSIEECKNIENISNKKRYVVLSGDISADDRNIIKYAINSDVNAHGEKIHILIITPSGTEGLNLRGFRRVYILSPPWNYSKLLQISFRAIRFGSHNHLKEEERNVKIIILLLDYPSNFNKSEKNEKTTDIHIFEEAINDEMFFNEFRKALVEGSIDCSVHKEKLLKESILNEEEKDEIKKIKCKMCSPNGVELYDLDFDKTMKTVSPCKEKEEIIKKVNSIKYLDKLYYYSFSDNNEIDIYNFNEKLGAYTQIKKNSDLYYILNNLIVESISS